MFDPQLMKFLEKHGWVADGVRAIRPGGPMDRVGLRTRCTACLATFSGSVKRFFLCDGRCACGAEWDSAPLDALVRRALTPGGSQTPLPEGTFSIDPESEHES